MKLNNTIPTNETPTQRPPAIILLVEDNLDVAELICFLLKESGFDTQHTTTVGQGMLLAVTEPPALILLDIDLPDGDGFSFCRRLKAHPITANVPVIFCTGRPDARAEAFAAGGYDCVSKPADVSELPMRIQRALDHLAANPAPKSNNVPNPVNHDE